MKLTQEECEDISNKILAEGFDYYFTCYGPDRKLDSLIGDEITDYVEAKNRLIKALTKVGVEVDE